MFVSISGFLFFEIIFTNIDWLSVFHVITPPIFAFNVASDNFFTVADSTSSTHNSTPVLVVFVKATFFWFGDQLRLESLGFCGKPSICFISPLLFFKFFILTLL